MLAWVVVSLLSFAAAGASFVYVPLVGRKLSVALAVVGFVSSGVVYGHQLARADCNVAGLKAELRIAKDDLDAAHAAAEKATEIQAELNATERKNQELADALSHIPNACLATDDDAKRLRDIQPRRP